MGPTGKSGMHRNDNRYDTGTDGAGLTREAERDGPEGQRKAPGAPGKAPHEQEPEERADQGFRSREGSA